jgi:hypothetical protein
MHSENSVFANVSTLLDCNGGRRGQRFGRLCPPYADLQRMKSYRKNMTLVVVLFYAEQL